MAGLDIVFLVVARRDDGNPRHDSGPCRNEMRLRKPARHYRGLKRGLDREDRTNGRLRQTRQQKVFGRHGHVPPTRQRKRPTQLAGGERHFVGFELGEPSTDACAENERAIGIEEIGLYESEAAAGVAERMQGAQHIVETQDQMVQDAVAEHQIEPAETSEVVGEEVQFFETEVWERIGLSRVIQKFVADIDAWRACRLGWPGTRG